MSMEEIDGVAREIAASLRERDLPFDVKRLGVLPVAGVVDPSLNTSESPDVEIKAFSLEGLVRVLADNEGRVHTGAVVAAVTGGEHVSKEDLHYLTDEIRLMAADIDDIAYRGKGKFEVGANTVGTKRPHNSKQTEKRLDRMMRESLGPPKKHLPRDYRARQKALRQLRKKPKRR